MILLDPAHPYWGDPLDIREVRDAMTVSGTNYDALATLVAKTTCKPGWKFQLVEEPLGLRLVISVDCKDARREPSTRQNYTMTVRHYFPVPTATYNEATWRRWIFEMCRRVENHELGEWFMIDGQRPFSPLHGPGEDPYTIHEFRDPIDAQTKQDGST